MGKITTSGYRLRVKIFWSVLFCFSLFALGFATLALTFIILGVPPSASEIFNHSLMFVLTLLPAAVASLLTYRICRRKLEQKTREISEASRVHLATVEALATAIDARDQAGAGHARRTQIYAVGLGTILRLPEAEMQALNTGALLHDIGKLAVPDHILNKPGGLTPAELEKTKIHPLVGASILEKVNFTYPVVEAVKHHHEHWDGTGYPDALKEKDIPLTARILAVADFYDTLRVARSYRAAVSREEARRIIINNAGTRFDPKIVDVFLGNLDKFEARIEAEGLGYRQADQPQHETSALDGDPFSRSYVEQIKQANREIFTLYQLARTFSSSLNLQDTLSLFVKEIRSLVPFDTCVIYLLNKAGNEARAVYAEGRNGSALQNRRIRPGEGATGSVLQGREPIYSINPALDFAFSQLELVQEYSSMAALPLIADDKVLGAVSLYSCTVKNYEEEHLRLLETVSLIASDALSKSIYHAETESRALTDPMTGLPNARSLQLQFEKEVARAERNGSIFQLLMLDLDGFKEVNDSYGHKVGDNFLKEIARVMRGQLRDYDFLARYAGDEFVAIIPETDKHSVQELCQRLEKAVSEFAYRVDENNAARVGISIGAASFPNGGNTLDQIIIAADKRMYQVKAQRKQKQTGELITPAPEPESYQQPAIAERKIRRAAQSGTASEQPAEPAVDNLYPETGGDNFVVELDESPIISSAIN